LITERKEAEEKLRESEEWFRTLAELSPDTIVVHVDGKVAFVNEAGTRMLGAASPDEIVGRPVLDLVHADFKETVSKRIGQVLDERRTTEFMEQQLITLDGRIVDVEAGSKPLTFGGRPAVQVVARDISERLRTQEKLRKSEAYYRGVVEDQTELICRFTPETGVTFVNDAVCRYFGKEREEMIGKSFLPFVPEQDRQLVKDAIASLTPENPVSGVEHRIRLESGETRWQLWTNRAIFDDENKLIGFQAVGRDITERKRSENMLKVTMRKLRAQRRQLTDSNLALKQVLDHIERERQDYKQRLCQDIEMALSPLIARLREGVATHMKPEVEAVEQAMKSALTKDIDVFRDRYSSLTSRELEVCDMIKRGHTSKEIADTLNLSLLTVHKHREQIRKKLGLKNKGVNLSTFLRSR
jgi:PAS domain S-box-containing protein